MKQITKYIGMVAIIAVFAIAAVSGSIDEADAKIQHDKHVKLAEAEPDVNLKLIQVFEPVKSSLVPVESTKGYVPASFDSDTITYQVVYRIQNDGTTNVKSVMISVHSDTETVEGKLIGWLEPGHSIVTVMVKAVDSTSIDAKIIGYKLI